MRDVFGIRSRWSLLLIVAFFSCLNQSTRAVFAGELKAGVGKVDITDRDAGPVADPLYVKALVFTDGTTTAAIVTLDAVAIGGIGYVKDDYLGHVRERIEKELKIPGLNTVFNASHCHGIVCQDVEERTFQAVKSAVEHMVPVNVGTGSGYEDRIMENRRLKLKSGREADVRHAYSLPADDEVAEVGPVDPEIGILRVDKKSGGTLAVVYNFACHPIQGVPSGGNTADITGYASQAIEDNLTEGAVALFVQGCGGDINPISYKDVNVPRNAETLGNLLGLSTLRAIRKIDTKADDRLTILNETLAAPRSDNTERILAQEAEQQRLLKSLHGTTLNLKTFIPLLVKYDVAGEFPSYYSHRYLHDKLLGRDDLPRLDAENRRAMESYMQNIYTMEELTRVQTNLALLRKHHASYVAAGKRTIDCEVVGLRIGDFVLVTFPGELTVRIGLKIKKRSPFKPTFVAGYTNGYIYYAPTKEQLLNVGNAQEDSDCILAPEWEEMFHSKVDDVLKKL